jgi:hypothetical protein
MNAAVKPESLGKTVFGKPDERELRDRMKKELPADTFKPQTWRVIWFLPLQLIIWGGIAAIFSDLVTTWSIISSRKWGTTWRPGFTNPQRSWWIRTILSVCLICCRCSGGIPQVIGCRRGLSDYAFG